jgi:hypothetical protein
MRTPKETPVEIELTRVKAELRKIVDVLQDFGRRVERASFTIEEWCERHDISVSQYYKLSRSGRGPRTMSTGDVGVRISREADADWIKSREREADEERRWQESRRSLGTAQDAGCPAE